MTDGPERTRRSQRSEPGQPVENLASEALRVLARKRGAGPAAVVEKHVSDLRDAVLEADPAERERAVAMIQKRGVSNDELIDLYIPEVARRMGEEWVCDDSTFADVTIAVARLQGLLRKLSHDTPSHRAFGDDGVAVAVIADDFHTLGAMILTAQLRRLGVSVRLMLDVSADDVPDLSDDEDRYDAIMISASHVETLDKIRKFVEKIRRSRAGRSVPIVVGGPILAARADVRSATGADFATSDVVEALRLCQLRVSQDAQVATASGP